MWWGLGGWGAVSPVSLPGCNVTRVELAAQLSGIWCGGADNSLMIMFWTNLHKNMEILSRKKTHVIVFSLILVDFGFVAFILVY